jgi:hypothetical protein
MASSYRLQRTLALLSLAAGLSLSWAKASQAFKLPKPPQTANLPARPVQIPVQIPTKSPVKNLVKISSLDAQIQSPPPITTSFKDAHNQIFLPDDFGKDAAYRPLTDLPRTAPGGFLLQPGFYELTVQSYSLQVGGTQSPPQNSTQSPGYLNAPLQGPQQAAIQTLLRNALQHPEIQQQQIQQLIWVILCHGTVDARLPASALLTPAQISDLNRGALEVLPPETLRLVTHQLPVAVQQQLAVENQMRQLLSQPSSSFEALELMALRSIEPPSEPSSEPSSGPEIPLGRWSDHEGGYVVRYFPSGYGRTRIQIYVPDGLKSAAEYDPSGHVAVSSRSQRLALSARWSTTDQRSSTTSDRPAPEAALAPISRPKPENVLENLPDRIPVIRIPATSAPSAR